jgi:hypothetical protein
MLRDLELKDLKLLEQIHDRSCSFPMPYIIDPRYVIKTSILSDDKRLIGMSFVKSTCELSLILDSEISKFSKSRALKELFKYLPDKIIKKGFNDVHLIADSSDYAELLNRHFEFKENEGISMYRRTDGK